MKVLLCSPYSESDQCVKGGINTWGRNILSYNAESNNKGISLLPISFDRTYDRSGGDSFITRLLLALIDYYKPVKSAVKAIRHDSPDVIHVCTSAGYGLLRDLFLLKRAKRYGVKSAVHFHFGRIPELYKQNNWEWKLISRIVRLCDIAIVMDRFSERVMVNAGFTNVKYLPNPVGMDTMCQINKLRNDHRPIPNRLLFAGHVLKTKGVVELVQACKRISGINLRIVGKCTPEMKYELEQIASEKAEGKWLSITGEVNHYEVLREILQADLFVFPSYTEGFPNVILEAMACGCPIVSSDVGAIPEMLDIQGNPCGICFKPQSEDEVYTSIMHVLSDPAKKKSYSTKGRERVLNMYDMPNVWQQLVSIWSSIS